jgi:ABC-2 type transport system ATP-binding protein
MTMIGNDALALQGLCKRFGDFVAVDSVSLSIPTGSLYGLLGPNGAGKTTVLSMAVGLLQPDAGSVRIFDVDVWADPSRAKAMVGVLPDGLSMPERLSGIELLTFIGRMRKLDQTQTSVRAHELLDLLELDDDRKLVIDYSTGMRKKLGLATAILHAPRLLVIRRILQRFVAGGGSVIISSHVMALVEQLCDTVAVVAHGRVLAEGPLDVVRGTNSLEDRFAELVGANDASEEVLPWLVL